MITRSHESLTRWTDCEKVPSVNANRERTSTPTSMQIAMTRGASRRHGIPEVHQTILDAVMMHVGVHELIRTRFDVVGRVIRINPGCLRTQWLTWAGMISHKFDQKAMPTTQTPCRRWLAPSSRCSCQMHTLATSALQVARVSPPWRQRCSPNTRTYSRMLCPCGECIFDCEASDMGARLPFCADAALNLALALHDPLELCAVCCRIETRLHRQPMYLMKVLMPSMRRMKKTERNSDEYRWTSTISTKLW